KRTTAPGALEQAGPAATEHRGTVVSTAGPPRRLRRNTIGRADALRLPGEYRGRSPSHRYREPGGGRCRLSAAGFPVPVAKRPTPPGAHARTTSPATEHRGKQSRSRAARRVSF